MGEELATLPTHEWVATLAAKAGEQGSHVYRLLQLAVGGVHKSAAMGALLWLSRAAADEQSRLVDALVQCGKFAGIEFCADHEEWLASEHSELAGSVEAQRALAEGSRPQPYVFTPSVTEVGKPDRHPWSGSVSALTVRTVGHGNEASAAAFTRSGFEAKVEANRCDWVRVLHGRTSGVETILLGALQELLRVKPWGATFVDKAGLLNARQGRARQVVQHVMTAQGFAVRHVQCGGSLVVWVLRNDVADSWGWPAFEGVRYSSERALEVAVAEAWSGFLRPPMMFVPESMADLIPREEVGGCRGWMHLASQDFEAKVRLG